jgi:hypothetical protein
MSDKQLMAAGLLVAALAGIVVCRQVAVAQGAILGLDSWEVLVLGAAVSAVATRRVVLR